MVRVAIAAVFVATAAAAVVLYILADKPAIVLLAEAANAQTSRSIDGRICGPFAHRPVGPRLRSTSGANAAEWRLLAAVADVNTKAQQRRTPTNLHALGIAYLLARRWNDAAETLEEALHRTTGEGELARAIAAADDPELLSDLAAAYVAHTAMRRGAALAPAIAAATRALTIDPNSHTAHWNRAVALESLGARHEAMQSWDAYLRLDPASEWANEARRRARALQGERDEELWPKKLRDLVAAAVTADYEELRAIVARHPVRSVAAVERQFLPQWGAAWQRGDAAEADRTLRVVRAVARAVEEVTGDRLLIDVAADLASASLSRRTDMAAVYADLSTLSAVFRAEGTGGVARKLTTLRDRLEALRSVASIRFALAIARSKYEARDHSAALAEISAAEEMAKRYPVSAAQAFWFRGLAEASIGFAAEAAASYTRAADLYRSFGDAGTAATLIYLRAETLDFAGDFEQSWEDFRSSLRDIDLHGEAVLFDGATYTIARSALRRGYPAAALVLVDGFVERLATSDRTPYRCLSLIIRCETNARVGRADAAKRDCRAARELFATIQDQATRDRLEADLEIASAASDAIQADAIAPLTAAVAIAVRGKDHYRIARSLLARAQALAARGDDAEAERDLRHGLQEIEATRLKLTNPELRIAWVGAARALYGELIRLLLRQRRIADAFSVSDAARGRVTLDALGHSSADVTVDAVQRALPPDAALIEYWIDSETNIVVFVVRREEIIVHRLSAPGLARRLRIALQKWESNEPVPPDAGAEALYDDLIGPWAGATSKATTLYIVPDGVLGLVPFAALRDRGGNLLIEQRQVIVAPSAAVFLAQKRFEPAEWTSALVIDDPTPPAGNADLGDLSTTRELAALAAGDFRPLTVLSGARATAKAFLAHAPVHDVVHFAGHAVESADSDPALVFAADEDHPSGLLPSAEIARSLRRDGGIVVLAACRTMRGRIGSDGPLSLARAFLAAGTSVVVGSLWRVEDEASDLLFASYYRHLRSGTSPGDALRRAQLELSRSHPSPHHWAAFQVYGGASQ